MADFNLNLSTQPFPAYRLTNIALAFVLVVLAVVSVWQASGYLRYSKMVRSIQPAQQESRIEAESLAKTVADLESRLDKPESTAKLAEIEFLNHLILRKSLSWTKLIAILEQIIPENVHLTSLAPDIGKDGTVNLRLGVRARTIADVKELLERLEHSTSFGKIDFKVEEKKDANLSTDVDVTMSTVYFPEKDGQ
jgi:cell division protein FtsB